MPASAPHYVVSDRNLLPMSEWQAAIDREDFLIRLRLEEISITAGRKSVAYLGDRRVTFHCERRRVADLLDDDGVPPGERWSHAYAIWGGGLMDSAAAAGMAAIAYATATGGATFVAGRGENRDFGAFKMTLDSGLSAVFGLRDRYAARYPADASQPEEPLDTIVTRFWIGDRMAGENIRRIGSPEPTADEKDRAGSR